MGYYYNKMDNNLYYRDNSTAWMGCLLILILCIIFGAIGGLVFMLLWNWLAPLFWHNAPLLTFWQAWGVTVLISWISNFFKKRSK